MRFPRKTQHLSLAEFISGQEAKTDAGYVLVPVLGPFITNERNIWKISFASPTEIDGGGGLVKN